MKNTTNRPALIDAWDAEMASAASARRDGDRGRAWMHLERAHIISQPLAGRHVRTHLAMLGHAVRAGKPKEVSGQLFRILVAAPGSWTGKYPGGNTGGANVSAFAPMPIPVDLRHLLEV